MGGVLFPPGLRSRGSQLFPQSAKGGSALRRGTQATRGRCSPLSRERPSQPGGCFSLPLALSPPGLTSGSGARQPLSVLVRSRRGPGRGAVNGGGGRRSGGRAQPRAPETLGAPQLFREVLPLRGRGRKGQARREVWGEAAGSRGDSNPRRGWWRSPPGPRAAAAPASFPAPSPRPPRRSLLGGGAPSPAGPPPRDLRALWLGRPRRAREAGAPRRFGGQGGGGRAARSPRRPGVAGPGPGCCMRGGVAVSGGEDGRFNAERCGAEILLGSLLLLRQREHQEGGGPRAGAGAVPGRTAAQRRGPPGNAAAAVPVRRVRGVGRPPRCRFPAARASSRQPPRGGSGRRFQKGRRWAGFPGFLRCGPEPQVPGRPGLARGRGSLFEDKSHSKIRWGWGWGGSVYYLWRA